MILKRWIFDNPPFLFLCIFLLVGVRLEVRSKCCLWIPKESDIYREMQRCRMFDSFGVVYLGVIFFYKYLNPFGFKKIWMLIRYA